MISYTDVICAQCGKPFKYNAAKLKYALENGEQTNVYCSNECCRKHHTTAVNITCLWCNNSFTKILSQFKRTKNHFCSQSCAAKYSNRHKKHGTRRSKLEVFLESKIKSNYPDLEVQYNSTNAIEMELDIFIPKLILAIEINGIFHYQPIYGETKLQSINANDDRKRELCLEKKINLITIPCLDKYINKKIQERYWEMVNKIISGRLDSN